MMAYTPPPLPAGAAEKIQGRLGPAPTRPANMPAGAPTQEQILSNTQANLRPQRQYNPATDGALPDVSKASTQADMFKNMRPRAQYTGDGSSFAFARGGKAMPAGDRAKYAKGGLVKGHK